MRSMPSKPPMTSWHTAYRRISDRVHRMDNGGFRVTLTSTRRRSFSKRMTWLGFSNERRNDSPASRKYRM
jgi:hypothetical protein